MSEKSLRLVIHGRVQGVWFRGWAAERARELGVRGWIRNRRDGTVEAVIAGEPAAVDAMAAACAKGPPMARVDRIETAPIAPPDEPGFGHRPTV